MTDKTEREAVVAYIRQYGDINMEMCGDGIMIDPLLKGGAFTRKNIAISKDCQITSTIHSSKFHACQELADAIERGDHLPAKGDE